MDGSDGNFGETQKKSLPSGEFIVQLRLDSDRGVTCP
jgi:hypothetical protein